MMSEDAIEKLIAPIVERQENINTYIIRLIAQRVKEIGELSPSDVYKLERLYKQGADARQINEELARLTNLTVKDIKKLIKTIAQDAYIDAKPFYDYRYRPYVPFEKNKELQRIVQAVSTVTAGNYRNLSNTKMLGFVIRDFKRPQTLKFQSVSEVYQSVIDEAVQAVSGGVVDYNTAMRRTMEQLGDSGLRVYWESGYTQRLDSAVRRNVMDGVRAINQGAQDIIGQQFGADGKEITVHLNSAPDHEPIQGHQFTNEEFNNLQSGVSFKDVNGNKFAGIPRAIGVWNCRHFTYSIIVGLSKPIYTQEQLNKMIADNHKGYTLKNGKHLTLYECSQVQRQMETKIRYAKDGIRMAKSLGDKMLQDKYENKLSKQLAQYQLFSRKTGLRMKTARLGGKV